MAFRARSRTIILGASAVAVSGAADTNENTLATVTVPAGAMGLNGILRVTYTFSYTNSANNKILRARFSGISGTQYQGTTRTTDSLYRGIFEIANRGASNSQVSGRESIGATSLAIITSAVDTSAATTLVFTGQKASAGETITLDQYLVELILP